MDNICFVPCATWIKRGVSKEKPDKVELTKEDLEEIIKETRQKLKNIEVGDDAGEGEEAGTEDSSNDNDTDGTPAAQNNDTYNMDNYEDEEEESSQNVLALGQMTEFANNAEDPYVTRDDAEDSDSEDEDLRVGADDNLIVSGSVDGDASTLMFHVFNEEEGSMYVHHDILLAEYPICVEWLNYEPDQHGPSNLVAVGSMSPIIEVWDADLVNSFEPAFRLGRKARKKTKKPAVGHKDAVLSLAWNRRMSHVLASGSADKRVLLWDLDTQQPATTLRCQEKVQTVRWHPRTVSCLLSADCAGDVRVWDCHTESSKVWNLGAEVERAVWDHFNADCILAGTEDGRLHYVDTRQERQPLWSVQAHEDACSDLALSPEVPGCLVTVSADRSLRVWDVARAAPQPVHTQPLSMGRLHCVAFSPDLPWMTCLGGDSKENAFKVWDIRESDAVRARFVSRPLTRVTPLPDESEQPDVATETVAMETDSDAAAARAADASGGSAPSASSATERAPASRKHKRRLK